MYFIKESDFILVNRERVIFELFISIIYSKFIIFLMYINFCIGKIFMASLFLYIYLYNSLRYLFDIGFKYKLLLCKSMIIPVYI